MIGTFPVLYIAWKLRNATRIQRADEIDLQQNMDEIAEHEKTLRLPGNS